MSEPAGDPAPRNSWTSLFQQTTGAVFLLSPRRRIRYVNPAFETLTKATSEQVVHEFCHPRKTQKDLPVSRRVLLQTLAPPKEVMQGRIAHVRRPVPTAKLGPPWWDIHFVPLRDGEKLLAVLGTIEPIGTPSPSHPVKTLSESLAALRRQHAERYPLALFDSDEPNLRRIHAQAALAAKTHSPVWIIGEAGTGKETLARAIHHHGITRELAFAAIDCGGLQPYLLRSLLSGHNGLIETGRIGTLYLKSADSLPVDLQIELIEWGELLEDECRIVVGVTPRSALADEFRAAFGLVEIWLPTLAERKRELPALIARLDYSVTADALAILGLHSWPGNLHELRGVLMSAKQAANGGRIEPGHLPRAVRSAAMNAKSAAAAPPPRPFAKLDDVLEKVERRLIDLAMRRSKGDPSAAAELLGIVRTRLARRLKSMHPDGENPV